MPIVANLTPHETGIKGWSHADFVRAMREVKWPDGKTDTLPGVEANIALTIEEGKGIVTRTPFNVPKARPAGSK